MGEHAMYSKLQTYSQSRPITHFLQYDHSFISDAVDILGPIGMKAVAFLRDWITTAASEHRLFSTLFGAMVQRQVQNYTAADKLRCCDATEYKAIIWWSKFTSSSRLALLTVRRSDIYIYHTRQYSLLAICQCCKGIMQFDIEKYS